MEDSDKTRLEDYFLADSRLYEQCEYTADSVFVLTTREFFPSCPLIFSTSCLQKLKFSWPDLNDIKYSCVFLTKLYHDLFRIKIEFGNDGSLESRLYLSGAGPGDAGPYSCLMPGMESVAPATVNISVTMGEMEDQGNTGV